MRIDHASIKAALCTRIEPGVTSALNVPVFLVAGSIFSVFGLAAGFVVGAFMIPFPIEYGGLPGYEGSGLFGSVLGVALASLLLILLCARDFSLRRTLYLAYLVAWVPFVFGIHAFALLGGTGNPLVAPLPMLAVGAFAAAVQSNPLRKRSAFWMLGGVAAAITAFALLTVLAWSAPPQSVPPNDLGMVIEYKTFTDVTMVAKAERDGATATVVVRRERPRSAFLAAVGLEPRYDAKVTALNRFDYPFLFDAMDMPFPEPPADATGETQQEDLRLALDAVTVLESRKEVRERFGNNLRELRHGLGAAGE